MSVTKVRIGCAARPRVLMATTTASAFAAKTQALCGQISVRTLNDCTACFLDPTRQASGV